MVAVNEYITHYHTERNHQGKDNQKRGEQRGQIYLDSVLKEKSNLHSTQFKIVKIWFFGPLPVID